MVTTMSTLSWWHSNFWAIFSVSMYGFVFDMSYYVLICLMQWPPISCLYRWRSTCIQSGLINHYHKRGLTTCVSHEYHVTITLYCLPSYHIPTPQPKGFAAAANFFFFCNFLFVSKVTRPGASLAGGEFDWRPHTGWPLPHCDWNRLESRAALWMKKKKKNIVKNFLLYYYIYFEVLA